MLFSARQLPRYDLAIYAPGAAPLYLKDSPAVGGAERQMMMLARALAALGLRVCHVVENLPGLPPSGTASTWSSSGHGHHRDARPFRVLALESLRRADASVYIQRSAGLVTGVVGLYSRLRRRGFIYSTSSSLDLLADRIFRARDNCLLRLGLRLADVIVVQTRDQRAAANRFRHVVRIPSFCEPASVV